MRWRCLEDVPRTANVVADSTVTALWLTTESMQAIISESPEFLEVYGKLLAMRFAENLLGYQRSLQRLEPNAVSRWLNEGEVLSPADGENVNLYGKIAVIINGQVLHPAGRTYFSTGSVRCC